MLILSFILPGSMYFFVGVCLLFSFDTSPISDLWRHEYRWPTTAATLPAATSSFSSFFVDLFDF